MRTMTLISSKSAGFTAVLSLLVCSLLSSCSTSTLKNSAARPTAFVTGGQQPIAGAHIYLLSLGQSGIASASTSMLLSTGPGVTLDANSRGYITSAADGSFSFSGDYAPCPDPTDQVYALALGGNPGLTAGSTNAAIALAAALGPCGSLSPTRNIQLNELTSLAFATAFTTYAADLWHIGAPAALTPATRDAAAAAASLVNLATGQPQTTSGIASVPTATINTLGNAIAACVNSPSVTSPTCSALFTATATSSSTPTDTFTALLNLAANPGTAQQALFNLGSGTAPFAPSLSQPPSDWTLVARLPATLSSTAGLTALGDSISTVASGNGATPITGGYTQLLANLLGQPFANFSQGGDEAIDTASKAWFHGTPTNSANPPITLMIGTNDVSFGDPTLTNATQEQAFHDTLMAALTLWLTPPRQQAHPQ